MVAVFMCSSLWMISSLLDLHWNWFRISNLNSVFALKQLGDIFWELKSSPLLLVVSSCHKLNMWETFSKRKKCSLQLSWYGPNYFEDSAPYRSIVGALQYVTKTIPEIGYSVHRCQFTFQPLLSHSVVFKRILRYLRGTTDFGLILQPTTAGVPFSLWAFCDADWASDVDDRRSTSGACLFLQPNLISLWSTKSGCQIQCRSRYRSLALAASEVLWVQSLLHELNVQITIPIIYCDNLNTVALTHNLVLHSRTKQMELDIFLLEEKSLISFCWLLMLLLKNRLLTSSLNDCPGLNSAYLVTAVPISWGSLQLPSLLYSYIKRSLCWVISKLKKKYTKVSKKQNSL